MAKSGGTKKAKGAKVAAKKKAASKPVKATAVSAIKIDSADHRSVLELKARWPASTPEEKTAFSSLVDDATRRSFAKDTKAVGVRADAVRWAVAIDKAFTAYPQLERFYSKQRFGYYLSVLEGLDGQIEKERGKPGAILLGDAEANARDARNDLVHVLESFAGQRSRPKAQLKSALGDTGTVAELVSSIEALVTLAGAWLALADGTSAILRGSAGLDAAIVDAARAAATALSSDRSDKTLAGPALVIDSPAVSLHEGSMLSEMREAFRCFLRANEKTSVITKLSGNVNTSKVVGVRGTRSVADPGAANAPPTATAKNKPNNATV